MHLRVTHRSNQWQCAEIVSARTFGWGHYRFELGTPADRLDPNVTLGLFPWSDDPAFAYREIDVECARWSNAADTNNAQFVVQPFDQADHLIRYRVPPGLTNSTHLFTWETNRVSFQALAGVYLATPAPSNLLVAWAFTNAAAVPPSGDENVRLNLWLFNGQPPSSSNEIEVVVRSFQFVPLGPPPPAMLLRPKLTGSASVAFDFTTAPDFRYQVRSSTDLQGWQDYPVLLATDSLTSFQDTNFLWRGARFYRAVTLP